MNLKELVCGKGRISEIVRFGLVGTFATGVQYGFYVIFANAIGLRAVPSALISYGLSFVFNYLLSSYFTFKKRPDAENGIGFILSHLINMGLQTGLVAIFKEIVGKTLALLPAMAICIPVNYCLVRFAFNHRHLFRRKDRRNQPAGE